MGWSSLAGVAQSLEDGKRWQTTWQKTTEVTTRLAARWYDNSSLVGYPVANTWAGTPLAFVDTNASSGFGIDHGPPVAPATKHVARMELTTQAALGAPTLWTLVDIQGYWPGISTTTITPQVLTGTPTLRYAGGAGVQMYFVVTTPTGATTSPIPTISYTNQDGTAGRTSGSVQISVNLNPPVLGTSPSGGITNRFPFVPLEGGDYGVRNAASVTMSGTQPAGVVALVLGRTIATIPSVIASSWLRRDYVMGMSLLPRVHDDACLVWLSSHGLNVATTTQYNGHAEFAWGGS
jgi:hypothetical protein